MATQITPQATLLRLQKSVSSANGVKDLMPILRTLPLDDLKEFIQHKLKSLGMSALKYSYFNACNMEQILGDDLMQHMLSFTGLYGTKRVSKSWKQYCEKNEAMQILRMDHLKQTFPNGTKVQNTWIVHKHRTTLHPKEIELGYKLPLPSLSRVIDKAESNDRILFFNGSYDVSRNATSNRLDLTKNLMIIGVEDNVTLYADHYSPFSIWCLADIYFENVHLLLPIYHGKGTLWMNRVGHTGWGDTAAISMLGQSDSSLRLSDCEFDGKWHHGTSYKTAINISIGARDIHVERCLFRGMHHSCIEIYHQYNNHKDQHVALKCIGNIFEDNHGYTTSFLCTTGSDDDHNDSDLYRVEFKENMLRGFNGKDLTVAIDDANKLYVHN
eukprot:1150626_1